MVLFYLHTAKYMYYTEQLCITMSWATRNKIYFFRSKSTPESKPGMVNPGLNEELVGGLKTTNARLWAMSWDCRHVCK